MITLGIGMHHGASVTVIRDGEIIFCLQEERLNRLKNSCGFPWLALRHVYENVCRPEDVDVAVISGLSAQPIFEGVTHMFAPFEFGAYRNPPPQPANRPPPDMAALGVPADLESFVYRGEERTKIDVVRSRFTSHACRLPPARIDFAEHHVCHQLSCLPFLGDPKHATLLFSLDGVGDGICAMVGELASDTFRILERTPVPLSICDIYSNVTANLGMKAAQHEFKVMGLAPYARRSSAEALGRKFDEILWVDPDGAWRASYQTAEERQALVDAITQFERFDTVAGAVQDYFERMTTRWVDAWVRRTGIRHIGLSGGGFMNVKANKLIAELDSVESCMVAPSCSDDSLSIGAACFAWGICGTGIKTLRPVGGLYLGTGPADLDGFVERNLGGRDDLIVERPADPALAVAQALAEGEIVAVCAGRAEFGARALGARSILADPRRPDVVRRINASIKNRDFWMPFAPSVLAEHAHELLLNPKSLRSPHMMFAFDTTPEGRTKLAAAIHPEDGTARAQIVERDHCPGHHAVIKAFHALTGVPAVLNTSFNLHGEPNVETAADALRTFDNSGLTTMRLGDHLIRKRA